MQTLTSRRCAGCLPLWEYYKTKNIVKCIHNPVGADIICLQKIINDNMQLSVLNLQMYFKKCMSIVKRIHNLVGADIICPLCIIRCGGHILILIKKFIRAILTCTAAYYTPPFFKENVYGYYKTACS